MRICLGLFWPNILLSLWTSVKSYEWLVPQLPAEVLGEVRTRKGSPWKALKAGIDWNMTGMKNMTVSRMKFDRGWICYMKIVFIGVG